jgi:hypothetical protein
MCGRLHAQKSIPPARVTARAMLFQACRARTQGNAVGLGRGRVTIQARLVGKISMAGRELGCPANSSFVAKPALRATFQGVRHRRSCGLRLWGLGDRRSGVAIQTVLAGKLNVVGRELGRLAHPRLVAKPAVTAAF